jgi:hypothetical protein
MTTGLVWLKKADWGGVKQWANCSSGDGAHTRVAQLWDGSPWEGTAALSDGSIEGDWQLPTKNELVDITVGTEYIRSSSMYFFTGVSGAYWSSSTHVFSIINAWLVNMFDGDVYFVSKNGLFEVWPVRRDNDR